MNAKGALYKVLELPAAYSLSRPILACGATRRITCKLAAFAEAQGHPGRTLDVGCGPASYLSRIGWSPVGLDINARYVRQHSGHHLGVVGSATHLPFRNECFRTVCTIGLLHHLTDEMAAQSVREMVRVCSPGGRIIIFDAVPPVSPLRRPLAYWIRRLDRGEFVRTERELRTLLSRTIPFPLEVERFTFTYTGLEALVCSGQTGIL